MKLRGIHRWERWTLTLKTLGFWFYLNGTAMILGQYFEQAFLPMTGMPECGSFDSGSYLATLKSMAQHVLLIQENVGREFSDDEIISEMIRLVDCGCTSFDLI